PGSVIVDMAAETGGNVEVTEPGQVVVKDGVTIDGTLNLASQMPFHASLLYGNNIVNLLKHLAPDGNLALDFDDEVTAGAAVTHDGKIVNERVREAVEGPVNA
ncbi:MAG: NAD(P)(+) transhydrogenase (Re/Si-specific) subunit alpha, partial [Pseudonocardia sp.]